MPVYKDEERKTWYASFYYTNWNGEKKKKKKRGFKTQREAKEYEREFKIKYAESPQITFNTLYNEYIKDIEHRIRVSTLNLKKSIYKLKILPYFKDRIISEIKPGDIRKWQNAMLEMKSEKTTKGFSPGHLYKINAELSEIFKFGVNFYGLSFNPCDKVGHVGSPSKKTEMNFWTIDEYNVFIAAEEKKHYHLCFDMLFWGGFRIGEVLALTPKKIDREKKAVYIDSTYQRINGKDHIGPPKSKNSYRTVELPDFVYNELIDYVDSIYELGEDDRVFNFQSQSLNYELSKLSKITGIKKIRVHDLRHSHVSLLIELGFQSHAIAGRIGDTVATVDSTYAHLYPNIGQRIVQSLEKAQNNEEKSE